MFFLLVQDEATYIQEIMTTADGQMVQHLVTAENQVGGWGAGKQVGRVPGGRDKEVQPGRNTDVCLSPPPPAHRCSISSPRTVSSLSCRMNTWSCPRATTSR